MKMIKTLAKRLGWALLAFFGLYGYINLPQDDRWIAAGILGVAFGIAAQKMWPFEEGN